MLRAVAWGTGLICVLSHYGKENAIALSLGQTGDDLHIHLHL